jgi:hypothetical protein
MSQTTTSIPEFVTMADYSMADLSGVVTRLLADNSDLAAPTYFSVSQRRQQVDLQFPDSVETYHVLHQWAKRFSADLTGYRGTRENGSVYVHSTARFTYSGVTFEAYASITTGKASNS